MSAIAFFWHFLGFLAPAVALGAMVALAARLLWPLRLPWALCAALNAVVAALVLMAGLVCSGSDGSVGSYAAAVLAVAGVQWVALDGLKMGRPS